VTAPSSSSVPATGSPIANPAEVEAFARFAAALAGQYELEREIGRGGMGIVYLARDTRLERQVAIKTLPVHLANDPLVRERFLREARTAARLSHPHIVPVHRADEIAGHVFFVMGYVDGESLAQRIRRLERLEPRDTVRVMSDVADALGYAHAHGVIHRDVKAENILLDAKTGRAMVTDFGIARLAEAAPLTATGQVLGTVYYVSPEQVSGERIDARSDIYSLGVVGFLALSGRFPFDADLASAVLIAHVTKSAPPLHTLAQDAPRALADVVDRCLAKDAAARFQSCADLSDALELVHLSEDGASGKARAPATIVSDTEAQLIWQRAADLQALTGTTPQPPVVAEPRDPVRDAEVTRGFRLTQIRDAAVEAGIPAKYVEQVFAEHGLAASQAALPVADRTATANRFLGSPTRLEYEIVVDGEMPTSDYDLLLEVIRRNVGESGTLGSVGRSFTWQSAARRNVQVSVVPRSGRTTIRVSENLRNLAGGLFGGIMGGYGGGSTGMWIAIGVGLHSPLIGVGLWLGNVGLAYSIARGLLRAIGDRRGDSLRRLAEDLAAEARVAIDAAQPKLPRG
jgi:eukaryotic-like serine/threonine-protein kinase